MDVFTRRIIGFGVERAYIDGVSVCRMFNHAVAGRPQPKHVSIDHDPLFRFHRRLANLRVLEIEEIKSVPYALVSHPFIERLIGTVLREYLDQVFFWNAIDLRRKLDAFADYYNAHRVHRSLNGTTPIRRACASSPPPARVLLFANMLGRSIVAVCFIHRFQPEYEFATNTPFFDHRVKPCPPSPPRSLPRRTTRRQTSCFADSAPRCALPQRSTQGRSYSWTFAAKSHCTPR